MCNEDHACLTQCVSDNDYVQISCVQDVTHRIESALGTIPPAYRHYIATELFNLAVCRLKQELGESSQTMSMRCADTP
jgi:hypothetical protein